MSTEADRIIRERTTEEVAVAYAFGRLAVEAGKAAADLLAAANYHDAAHGSTDGFVLAAFEAVGDLSDLATRAARYGPL